jgi:HSP20 family molecular chaperone IbpA
MKISKIQNIKSRFERLVANYISKMGEEYEEMENRNDILSPPSDVYMDLNRQLIFIETPALDLETVKIAHSDDTLTFKAEKTGPLKTNRHYIHMERSAGSYHKNVQLEKPGSEVKDINFTYKYGVIKITVTYGDS